MKKGIITQEKRVTWETEMIISNSYRLLDQYNQSDIFDDDSVNYSSLFNLSSGEYWCQLSDNSLRNVEYTVSKYEALPNLWMRQVIASLLMLGLTLKFLSH